MIETMWIRYLNEGLTLFLLIAMGLILYRGIKRNQTFLSEREEMLKRYLLFRGDLQVRLKVYGEDEGTHQELLRNLSEGWKNFKRTYDQYLRDLSQNATKTTRFLQLLTLGLLINSGRLLVEEYYFSGIGPGFFYRVGRELSNYVLVALSFFILRIQTHRFLSIKGEFDKMDREILFYSNNLSEIGGKKVLYDEFSPLEKTGGGDGKKD